jgi:hypothetical protein
MPWTDSDTEIVTLGLRGVWLWGAEEGGEDSARHFPYGASNKSDTLDAMGVSTFYAGRQDPVVDFGEHVSQTVNVAIDVPHGATYLEDLEALDAFARDKRTVHYRDSRMRSAYGTMNGLTRTDQDWGSVVSFQLLQVHVDQELVSA